MRSLRTVILVTGVIAGMAMTPAALAAGKAPQGNGLSFMSDDYHISNLACDDEGIEDILLPVGHAGWIVGDGEGDRLYNLQTISGELTAHPGTAEEFTYSFTQSFGKKTGKASNSVTCTVDFAHTHDGVREEGEMTFVLLRIW